MSTGVASEDALEIAYAERRDHRGRMASLFILAEPDRPGSGPFIGELVSRIGEEFLDGEGSLTGILQRVVRERHEELLDWNRNSLPRDQASYGLSCLLVREGDVFLMQLGPCLAYYRREGRLLRRRPSSEEAAGPLGGSEASAPEFSQLRLGEGDWVLLISSEVATTIGEDAIGALRSSPAEDVLPALYPKLRTLARVSALVVAPGRGAPAPAEAVGGEAGAAGLEAELTEDPAAASAPGPSVAAAAPAVDWSENDEAGDEEDAGERFDEFPERTSVGAAIGGFFAALGGAFRRRPPAADPWAEADGEDGFGAESSEPPPPGWDPSPVSDPEIGGAPAAAAPETEDASDRDAPIDPVDDTPIGTPAPIVEDGEAAVADDAAGIDEAAPHVPLAGGSPPEGPPGDEGGSSTDASVEDDSSREMGAVKPGGAGAGEDDEPPSPGTEPPGGGASGGCHRNRYRCSWRVRESARLSPTGTCGLRCRGLRIPTVPRSEDCRLATARSPWQLAN